MLAPAGWNWTHTSSKAVGNYGEITTGTACKPRKLERGLKRLWTQAFCCTRRPTVKSLGPTLLYPFRG